MNLKNNQKGGATLFTAISILVLMTLVLLFTARTMVFETKVSSNFMRGKQAFEAAETGVNYAIENFEGDALTCIRNVTASTCVANVSATSNTAATFDLTVDENGVLESVGYSDDKSARHVIYAVVDNLDPLPSPPDNPLTARGTAVIQGSATIYNPEGASTIWSGKQTDLGSNNSTATYVADPSDVGALSDDYPACLESPMTCRVTRSSNKTLVGLDVVSKDSNLANLDENEFFANFMGATPANYERYVATKVFTPAEFAAAYSAGTLAGEVVWVNGDLNLNGAVLGCGSASNISYAPGSSSGSTIPYSACDSAPDPMILVVDGDMTASGNNVTYGYVYVRGDFDSAGGNFTVHGAMVVEENADPTGSLDIWFNSSVLTLLRDIGNYSIASGSWRDFE